MTDPQWVPPGAASPPPARSWQAPAPGGQATHAGVEFRPGIIPLRPLTLGDLYGGTVKAVRGNVGATMGLALVTTLVFLVPTTALGAWVASSETADLDSEALPVAGTVGQYVPTLGTYLSAILLTGFVAHVIGEAVQGRRTTAGRTWEGTRPRVPSLVGATLLTTAAMVAALALVVAGPVLLLVAAVHEGLGGSDLVAPVLLLVLAVVLALLLVLWVSTRLAFLPAVLVLERVGVGAGLRRSWLLTSGRPFWRVLGIRLLTSLIVGTVAQVIAIPLALLSVVGVFATGDAEHLFVWQAVITGLTGLATGALTTPFTAGVDSLLYVDQRIRREGFDVALLAATREPAPGVAAGA
jgi:hypothetical protein